MTKKRTVKVLFVSEDGSGFKIEGPDAQRYRDYVMCCMSIASEHGVREPNPSLEVEQFGPMDERDE